MIRALKKTFIVSLGLAVIARLVQMSDECVKRGIHVLPPASSKAGWIIQFMRRLRGYYAYPKYSVAHIGAHRIDSLFRGGEAGGITCLPLLPRP